MFTEQAAARQLRDQEMESAIPVLALDLDTLKCVQASAVNFSDWGCKLVGPGLSVLRTAIAIKIDDADEFQRGKITGRKADYVTIVFQQDVKVSREKRSEPRYPVTVAAKVYDLARTMEISCVITDASKSGCRIEGARLDTLPDEILVFVDNFDTPVRGQIAWKKEDSAGLRLNWDGARKLR